VPAPRFAFIGDSTLPIASTSSPSFAAFHCFKASGAKAFGMPLVDLMLPRFLGHLMTRETV
jgi:hypothetical protein